MIETLDKEIDGKMYILSKFPAVAGREIIAKYPLSSLPKLGEYAVNEETMFKLMSFVGVYTESNNFIRLTSKALVDNHVPNWETLAKIEIAMLEYNCSFFQNGRISRFFDDIAQNLPAWISKMLTALSGQLSQQGKQP